MGIPLTIRIFPGSAVSVVGADGEVPYGEVHLAIRRALHAAQARAGGQLDVPGHGDACLSQPDDIDLAVGVITSSLVAEGHRVETVPVVVPFQEER